MAGLFALQRFIDQGLVDRGMQRTLYPTYLAGMFRTLGFGLAEAHGQGMAVQMSWFLEHGAVSPRKDGTFAFDEARMREPTKPARACSRTASASDGSART